MLLRSPTPLRWKSSTAADKTAWRYFDEIAAPDLIAHSLQSPTLTFKDLYHALAKLRLKCEWVKKQKPTTLAEAAYHACREVSHDFSNTSPFGEFKPAGTAESKISTAWGPEVAELIKARLGEKPAPGRRIGLSTYLNYTISQDTLNHPHGYILPILENDFKALLATTNFFDFIQLAAQLMFALSNFPPILRGSAAVNQWIIDNITFYKFGIKPSIKPELADWTAFLETLEQYISFYVITTVVKYIKSIPCLYLPDKSFYDSLPTIMLPDPNQCASLKTREAYWQTLQNNLSQHLTQASSSLSPNDLVKIKQIISGKLIFRYPDKTIIDFVTSVMDMPTIDVDTIKKYLPPDYFMEMMHVSDKLERIIYHAWNNPAKLKALNDIWANLSAIHQLDKTTILLAIEELKATPTAHEDYPPTPGSGQYITYSEQHLLNTTFTIPGELPALKPELAFILDSDDSSLYELRNRVYAAFNSGGLRLCDLHLFNREQLAAVTDKAAIMVYNAHKFIHASDLYAKDIGQIHTNILKLLIKYYCGEELPDIHNPNLRNLLLHHCDLFATRTLKKPALANMTIEEVKRFLLNSYLEFYHHERMDSFLNKLNDDQLSGCLNLLRMTAKTHSKSTSINMLTLRNLFKSKNIQLGVILRSTIKDENQAGVMHTNLKSSI